LEITGRSAQWHRDGPGGAEALISALHTLGKIANGEPANESHCDADHAQCERYCALLRMAPSSQTRPRPDCVHAEKWFDISVERRQPLAGFSEGFPYQSVPEPDRERDLFSEGTAEIPLQLLMPAACEVQRELCRRDYGVRHHASRAGAQYFRLRGQYS